MLSVVSILLVPAVHSRSADPTPERIIHPVGEDGAALLTFLFCTVICCHSVGIRYVEKSEQNGAIGCV
jgi:hypothetical protein